MWSSSIVASAVELTVVLQSLDAQPAYAPRESFAPFSWEAFGWPAELDYIRSEVTCRHGPALKKSFGILSAVSL
jgi:hypothetical protein